MDCVQALLANFCTPLPPSQSFIHLYIHSLSGMVLMTIPSTQSVFYKWQPLQTNQMLKASERQSLESPCPDCFTLSSALGLCESLT